MDIKKTLEDQSLALMEQKALWTRIMSKEVLLGPECPEKDYAVAKAQLVGIAVLSSMYLGWVLSSLASMDFIGAMFNGFVSVYLFGVVRSMERIVDAWYYSDLGA